MSYQLNAGKMRFIRRLPLTKEIWYYEHSVSEGQKAYSMTRPIRFEHLKPCIDWWEKREEVVDEDHGNPAELLAKLEQSEAEAAKLRDKLKAILKEALLR